MTGPARYRLSDLAERFGGEVLGDPGTRVAGIASLRSAGEGDLSFLARGKFRESLRATRAAAVIVSREDRDATALPRIVCEDSYLYYAKVAELFQPRVDVAPGIHPSAVVSPRANVHPGASIGPGCHVADEARIEHGVFLGAGCVIGAGSSIGEGSRLHPRVCVYHGCSIGRRAIIHSGAVIGADGFGMALEGGRWRKIPQLGGVRIGDDVEIGANTTIDRGALDDTVIEEGVKLDNQIQIGHNVHIGAHSALAGCVGIAGSARIGRGCTLGGGAIVLGHLELADGVHVSAATVITRSIRSPREYAGLYPFQRKSEWVRNAALIRRLGKRPRDQRPADSEPGADRE
ncbi:MAG: UDP-3-O-(3-hydroxymyristoyl)glucosamine N-acyltransferase [Burkholderiales bacterium]|nr:UDP-3-O-(3-hydroxymyristoyl)glucosamine N-acyltransferase [Burkholderiales bacterium]